jgi:hypothetical protein
MVLLVAALAAVWRNKHAGGRMLRCGCLVAEFDAWNGPMLLENLSSSIERLAKGGGRIIREISRIEGQNDLLKLLQALDALEADEKRYGSEDAEAAVDGTPEGRDAAE